MCAQSLHLCPTLCDPMGCSPPGPSVPGFLRQEYWNGLPCPLTKDLPAPEVEPKSPASPALQVDSLTPESPGKPLFKKWC